MPETWASSGIDLHLDRNGPRVRSGLEAQLREAVRSGRLAPGLRLPSPRSLAADLGVARNTVVDVYGQLVAEGWLVARQGSVTRVAARAPVAEPGPPPADEARRPRHDPRAPPGAPPGRGAPAPPLRPAPRIPRRGSLPPSPLARSGPPGAERR